MCWSPWCCGGEVALIKYDVTNGDIIWQKAGYPHAYSVCWDDTNELIWYQGGDGLRARDAGGNLVAWNNDITSTSITAWPSGGVAVNMTYEGTPGIYHIAADGSVVGYHGSSTNIAGLAFVLSGGDILGAASNSSTLKRFQADNTVVWTTTGNATAPRFMRTSASVVASSNGQVTLISDGTHFANLTNLDQFWGTQSENGYWGGVSHPLGVPGDLNVFFADDDGNPVWDIDVTNPTSTTPKGCTDGTSVYISREDTASAPVHSSNIIERYDSGVMVWHQVGPRQSDFTCHNMIILPDGNLVVGSNSGFKVEVSEWIN